MVLSPPLLSELGAVFSRPRFGLNPEAVQLLMTDLESSATIVYPESRRRLVVRDPDDDEVVDCAIESRSKYIVSGDAHLSELGVVEGIPVIAPRQFVDLLREK
jgi:putative PIN family toxin of toxin-antitoxin system